MGTGVVSGTVTFLFTDIEESTRLWDVAPSQMGVALERHDEILRSAIGSYGGRVFATAGDGFAAAFGQSSDAIAAAVESQQRLGREPWPKAAEIRVRMGLHSGQPVRRGGDFFGPVVNQAARLMACAHGGQIVVSGATARLPIEGTRVDLVDLGWHRLKGLVNSVHIFGVRADGVDWIDRRLNTVETSPGNLPQLLTTWFGPATSVKRLVAELDVHRLVTLTGPGGVGKTRLAIEVAREVANRVPDGAWMVDLAPVALRETVFPSVAATLGVSVPQELEVLEAITGWAEDKRLLLLVDNCEHVLDPVAELATAMVRACTGVTLIATSREPLRVSGEQVITVPYLDEGYAVELFRDRARLADAAFDLSQADRPTVATICGRLDGIPLAIELAAARITSMTPRDLLARLDDRFRLLRARETVGDERHETLQAAVAWSYHLLSASERLLFDRLSVFAGGFDLPAAEVVCTGEGIDRNDVLYLLGELISKSLVVVDRTGLSARYRLLETLRHFGRERLQERDETPTILRRHLGHYVVVARAAYELWASPHTVEAVAMFDQDWDNLRIAHAYALQAVDLDSAEDLLGAGFQYALFSGRMEYLDWAQQAIQANRGAGRQAPGTLGRCASLAWFAGNYQNSVDLAIRGISDASDGQDPNTVYCWIGLAMSYLMLANFEQASRAANALRTVMSLTADNVDTFWAAACLTVVSSIVDPGSALHYADQSLTAATAVGAPTLLATQTMFQGVALETQGKANFATAADIYRRGIVLGRSVGAQLPVAFNLTQLVSLLASLEDDEADHACREAITTAYETGWSTQLSLAAAFTAGHLRAHGQSDAAGVISGYLEANHPSVLAVITSNAEQRGRAQLPNEPDPHASEWKTLGAAMTRSELVDYVLSVLPPE